MCVLCVCHGVRVCVACAACGEREGGVWREGEEEVEEDAGRGALIVVAHGNGRGRKPWRKNPKHPQKTEEETEEMEETQGGGVASGLSWVWFSCEEQRERERTL